jgi:Holliday junction DNA helicase RuvA
LFNHLISVSGIGPNTARLVLSALTPADIEAAILSEDELTFKRVKGVGPKTAKRLIIDLKDKMLKTGAVGTTIQSVKGNTTRSEALSALIALGYPAAQAQKALSGISAKIGADADTEMWIKRALLELSG